MKIVIAGASGFIGRALCRELARENFVIALTRRPLIAAGVLDEQVKIVGWDGKTVGRWVDELEGADAVVNLAGANVGAGRWSAKRKDAILSSRVESCRVLLNACAGCSKQPGAVLLSSAIGYYGDRGGEVLTEDSSVGPGFLAEVCWEVESFAQRFQELGIRTVLLRSGVVLDRSGGALVKMAGPFKFYAGAVLGNGKQWMSWISLKDQVAGIKFLIDNKDLSGPFNLTSPGAVTNRQFSMALAGQLQKPCWFSLPGFVLRAFFGQMADDLLLTSQRILPRRLLEAGFVFNAESIDDLNLTLG